MNLDHALDLASKGWWVHPLKDDKTPRTMHGLHDATTDVEQIRRWWAMWPTANVGVALYRSGVSAVDVDVKADVNGFESLIEQGLPTTANVEGTSLGGKGRHLLYRGVLRSGVGIFDGIDIRGYGSYVCAPYSLPHVDEVLEPAPGAFTRYTPGEQVVRGNWEGTLRDWLALCAPGEPKGALATALDAIHKEGVTHDQIRDFTLLVAGDAARGEPGAGQAAMEGRERYAAGWGDEYAAKYDQLLASAIDIAGPPLDLTAGLKEAVERLVAAQAALSPKERAAQRGLRIFTRADIDAMGEPEWIIDGVWQQGTVGILAGEGGIGKTFLMLDMVARAGLGQDWQGRRTRPTRTLFVAAEGARSFRARIRAWEQHTGERFPDGQVEFIAEGFRLTASDQEGNVPALLEYAVEFRADLIVLDTLSALSSLASENDASEVAAVLRTANGMVANTDRTVVIVHHSNKSTGKMRGSTALRDNVSTVVAARWPRSSDGEAKKEETFYLSTKPADDGKQKDGEPFKLSGFRVVPAGPSAVVDRVPETEELTLEEQVLQTVLADQEWHTMSDIAEGHPEGDTAATRKALQRSISRLMTLPAHPVEADGAGRGRRYRLRAFATEAVSQ